MEEAGEGRRGQGRSIESAHSRANITLAFSGRLSVYLAVPELQFSSTHNWPMSTELRDWSLAKFAADFFPMRGSVLPVTADEFGDVPLGKRPGSAPSHEPVGRPAI